MNLPQSLSKSHIHNFGMHRPFLQLNSVSGSQARLSKIIIKINFNHLKK